jgi:hypothetical protein
MKEKREIKEIEGKGKDEGNKNIFLHMQVSLQALSPGIATGSRGV